MLLAASFIMWVRGQLWDETGEGGKKDRLGTLVAMLPSQKATTVEVCNKLEMLGTVSVTGKDSFS